MVPSSPHLPRLQLINHAQTLMNRSLIAILLIAFSALLPAQSLDLRLAGAETRTSGIAEPPALLQYGAKHGLAFQATFLTDSPQRVFWDLPIRENLTHCAGIKLRFFCHKPTIVRQYNIYLRTGNLWHAATFSPKDTRLWQEIFIPKAAFMPESAPASWQQVSTLRLAFWKGATGRTVMHLASVDFVRPNCPVAILRSGTTQSNCREAYSYAAKLSRALETAGLLPAVIEEPDTTYLNLRPYSFVFYPFPSAASPTQLTHVASFLKRGGKAAVFHTLPPLLQRRMMLPAGRFTLAGNLGLTLGGITVNNNELPGAKSFRQDSTAFIATGRLFPPLRVAATWNTVDGSQTQFPAIIESPAGYWMTHVFLGKDHLHAADTFLAMVAKCLPQTRQIAAAQCYENARQTFNDSPQTPNDKVQARRLLETARNLYANAQFDATIQMTRDAMDALRNAGVQPLPPKPNELRAIWADLNTGLPGSTWAQTVKVLLESDINAAFTLGATPVLGHFNSKTTPLISSKRSLPQAVWACRANGIQVHAWLNCLSLEDAARDPNQKHIVNQWRQQQRLQINAAGKTLNWLCPSQMVNRRHVIRLAAEMATELKLDGIHLDFIRFPSSQACLCPSCQRAFQLFIGRTTNWPQAVLPGGPDRQYWLDFRQQLITTLVSEIADAVRQAKPTVMVSAAVFPDLHAAQNNVGQDWKTWLDNHSVSFICPMNYTPTDEQFRAEIARQIQQTHRAGRILPGIGLSVHNLTLQDTQKQIYSTRELNTAGFILFKLGLREAQDILPHIFMH